MRRHGDAVTALGRATLGGVGLFDLDERAMQSIRGRDMALVPQDASGSLDPLRRVGSQIVEVLRRHGIEHGRKAARQRAADLLGQVGIGADPGSAAGAAPRAVRGQPAAAGSTIAIAIACEPKVLVADEPTTALDVTIQAQVLDLFAKPARRTFGHGVSLAGITHDVGVAHFGVADRVAVRCAAPDSLGEEGTGRHRARRVGPSLHSRPAAGRTDA